MVDIEFFLEEVVIKVMGRASRKNMFWLISMDRDCIYGENVLSKPRRFSTAFRNCRCVIAKTTSLTCTNEPTDISLGFRL
jgi:hypothetical protein